MIHNMRKRKRKQTATSSSFSSSLQWALVAFFVVTGSLCLYSIRLSYSLQLTGDIQEHRHRRHLDEKGSKDKSCISSSTGPKGQPLPASKTHPQTAMNHESVSTQSYSWWNERALEGSTSCEQVRQYVRQRWWKDPNDQGQYHIRKITSSPHHYVSVHSQHYDRVRYNSIMTNGDYYERKVHQRFVDILDEGTRENFTISAKLPIVIDVGANIGYYSLLSAAMQHAVISFEINPSNLIRLCESIAWNHIHLENFGPIQIFRNGVSNQHNRTIHIHIPKRNPGEATFQIEEVNDQERSRTNPSSFNSQKYPGDYATQYHSTTTTVTLDEFAIKHGWLVDDNSTDIAILKIDTEGHEPFVLEGAQRLIQSGIIGNLLLEYRPSNYQMVVSTLLQHGYVLVYDQPNDTNRRSRTILSKEASQGYLQKLYRTWKTQNQNDNDRNTTSTKNNEQYYEDLWFRRSNMPLPKPKPKTKPSFFQPSSPTGSSSITTSHHHLEEKIL